MKDRYNPIDPDIREKLVNIKDKGEEARISFFSHSNEVKTREAVIQDIYEEKNDGEFLKYKSDDDVRLDRVITINGRPGPAYDEYDDFANECMDCGGGMDL
jgi:hypothetical protein